MMFDPAGVVDFFRLFFYKHLIPLESLRSIQQYLKFILYSIADMYLRVKSNEC